jgi:3'(2'), 5'-bisphosphate nucleotidase
MLNSSQISLLTEAMLEASRVVMTFYKNPDLAISSKEDLSPVTAADMASHSFFSTFLAREFPGIPLISEEAGKPEYTERMAWKHAWILDPLDGTKEFIAANDEFAINLALIENGRPVAGFIAIPAKSTLYAGIAGLGSWKSGPDGERQKLPIHRPKHGETRKIRALISRSHAGSAEKVYLDKLSDKNWQVETIPTGSSYKHVLLAEGAAELYAKPGPCWEWDTAAGQIILEEAGGMAVRMADGEPLVYNKENFLNPDFVMWAPGVFIPL